MLGLFLIYFIGKKFYDLADTYEQNKWLYAIISVVFYYAVGFVFGVVLFVLDFYVFGWNLDWENNFGVNLLGLPIGLLALWVLYMILESRWKKRIVLVKDEIKNIGNDNLE
ncbi:hypothetical protein AW14_07395 [Siansivirga zeaxanthinifaciens CC-SAMT-1]|uniref:Uncharacterized protein n=1 Tax=Siansivirga zeaxanthinifaciens CC-SAMT-1 TaxID=1454006 RepID=A0A0C5WI61_9FLAO|nr:hypothetical protein AW14_07395 [Siansivirga zeaxanthinifaciens CC-SAMT-1]